METRITHLRLFRLLILFVGLVDRVGACGSMESKANVLENRNFCLKNLWEFGSASPKLDISSPVETLFELASNEDTSSGPRAQLAPQNHEVRLSLGKGLGVFATTFIPQGSPILIEAPLISVPMPSMVEVQGFRITDMLPDIENAFYSLRQSDQNIFQQLHDHRFPSEDEPGKEQIHLLTIFRSNAYNTGDDRIGLFPRTARVNHGCTPNAGNWWSEKSQRRVIYALRNIEAGEEITVSYIPLLKTRKERQGRLAQYGFVCDCEACGDESGDGDRRRVRIREWLEDLEGKVGRRSKKGEVGRKRVEKARRLVGLVEEEGLGDYVARAYHVLAVFQEHVGDTEEARVWAGRELQVLGWAEVESDEAMASAEFVESLRNR